MFVFRVKLTRHTARAWSRLQASSIPWPAEKGSHHRSPRCGPRSSPSQKWACDCSGGTEQDRKIQELGLRFQGSKGGCGWTLRESGCTHGAIDGAQRHEALHVVGDGAAVSVPVGVLSSLHDELLALEVVVLETHPASQKRHREAGLHDAPFKSWSVM